MVYKQCKQSSWILLALSELSIAFFSICLIGNNGDTSKSKLGIYAAFGMLRGLGIQTLSWPLPEEYSLGD